MAEYCPHCRAYKETTCTTAFKRKKDRIIIINSYHCSHCHGFIKNEEEGRGIKNFQFIIVFFNFAF